MNARDMVPGKTYQGTADGPQELDGVAFTVLATASFHPEGLPAWHSDFKDEALVQVLYDAYAFPFPESQAFSPGDWVIEMAMDNSNPWLCSDCASRIHGDDPDMDDDYTWKPGTCFGCKRDDIITFKYTD